MRKEIPLWLGVVIIAAFVVLVGLFVWRKAGEKRIVPASEVLGGPEKAKQFQQRPGGPFGPGMPMHKAPMHKGPTGPGK